MHQQTHEQLSARLQQVEAYEAAHGYIEPIARPSAHLHLLDEARRMASLKRALIDAEVWRKPLRRPERLWDRLSVEQQRHASTVYGCDTPQRQEDYARSVLYRRPERRAA
jgi:hypothetical protein